jgi:hypothetical protein
MGLARDFIKPESGQNRVEFLLPRVAVGLFGDKRKTFSRMLR